MNGTTRYNIKTDDTTKKAVILGKGMILGKVCFFVSDHCGRLTHCIVLHRDLWPGCAVS